VQDAAQKGRAPAADLHELLRIEGNFQEASRDVWMLPFFVQRHSSQNFSRPFPDVI